MNIKVLDKVVRVKALVSSESVDGAFYLVQITNDEYTCTCPHYQQRVVKCKHIREVENLIETGLY